MKKSIFILALAAATAACNNSGRQQEEATEEITQADTIEAIVVPPDIFDKEWKLTGLNGQAIVLDTSFNAEPHLLFDKVNNRVIGNAGCNGFGANLERIGDTGIVISDIAATEMACPNLEIEQQFIEVLRKVTSYRIEGNTLTLTSENNEASVQLEKRN